MRIAIVFSSPNDKTKEFVNIWKCCPEKEMKGPDQVIIKGRDWELFAFDGQSRRYYDGAWNLETLKGEVEKIIEKQQGSDLGILLHGDKHEVHSLIGQLHVPDPLEIYRKWYSSGDKFYRKYIKPFASDGSDEIYGQLWEKLTERNSGEEESKSLAEKVCFLRHRLSNILTFMELKLNTSKINEDIEPLLEFDKFNIGDLLTPIFAEL